MRRGIALSDTPQLQRLFYAVWRRQRRVALASGGMVLLVALLLIVLASTVAHTWVTVAGPVRAVFLAVCLGLLSVVTMRLLASLVAPAREERLAIEIEQRLPDLKNRLISSVQLHRKMEDGQTAAYFSDSLIKALVVDTEARAAAIPSEVVVETVRLKRNATFLALCAFATLLTFAIAPGRVAASLKGLFHPTPTPAAKAVTAGAAPVVVGDITLHYSFPAYSRLEPKTVPNSSGDVRALRGSEVRISVRASEGATAANLAVAGGGKTPMAPCGPDRFEGRLSLMENGHYQFELTLGDGKPFLDPRKRALQIEPDLAPKVDLLWPAENMVVSERETIPLAYEATDDFGLTEVALVAKIGDKEVRTSLATLSDAPKKSHGTYNWSLATLDLSAVQEISYFVEAKDNDNVSGPKAGHSETRHLVIQNARKRHEELLARQQELLKRMLHLLAVDLTSPLDPKGGLTKSGVMLIESAVRDATMGTLDLFREILASFKEDSLANQAVYYALDDMRRELNDIAQSRKRSALMLTKVPDAETVPEAVARPLVEAQREQIRVVENDILILNGLIGKQRLESIQADMKRLSDAKDSLAKLMERLKKGDHTAMKELAALMAEMEQIMKKVAAETAKLTKDTPMGAFLSPDAMMDLGDLFEKIKAALAKGDREEAMKLLTEMMSALGNANMSFASADAEYSKSAFGGPLKEMGDLMTKLDELAQAESGVLNQSKAVKKAIQQRTTSEMDDKLRSFFEKQLQRLEKIKLGIKEADSSLGGDREVKECFSKDEELRNAIEQRQNLFGYLAPMDLGTRGKNMKERLDELNRTVADAKKALNEQKKARDLVGAMRDIPAIQEQLRQLQEMLAAWDVQESREIAEDAGRKMNYWEQILSNPPRGSDSPACRQVVQNKFSQSAAETGKMLEDLERMRQSLEDYQRKKFLPEERERVQELAKRQQTIRDKTGEVGQEIDKLQKQSAFANEEISEDMASARERMESARDRLEGERPGSAVTEEREALHALESAKARLKQAAERIAKGMIGGGMPMPEPGQREEGVLGVRKERVKLPSPEDYKVPEEFRQEILDAMKGPAPKEYDQMNKDYYKRLLEQ